MEKLIYDPEARNEIRDAAAYYESCREGLGQAFLESVEKAAHKISEDPYRWRTVSGRFRRCLVNKFPYGIIYTVDENEIYIAAVMHLKRRPGYWMPRTES
jgi:toxin ParE1/3/4